MLKSIFTVFRRAMFSEKDLVESALAGAGPAPQLDGDSDSDDAMLGGQADLEGEDDEDLQDGAENDEFDLDQAEEDSDDAEKEAMLEGCA